MEVRGPFHHPVQRRVSCQHLAVVLVALWVVLRGFDGAVERLVNDVADRGDDPVTSHVTVTIVDDMQLVDIEEEHRMRLVLVLAQRIRDMIEKAMTGKACARQLFNGTGYAVDLR